MGYQAVAWRLHRSADVITVRSAVAMEAMLTLVTDAAGPAVVVGSAGTLGSCLSLFGLTDLISACAAGLS